jgi:hypothetical protein
MLEFARRSVDDLQRIFREAGAQRAIAPHIVEKDFWVCWLLRLIFADTELGGHLVFKGGTSLSKVFGVIQRFSEDIDLSVDPDWLGFGDAARPDAAPSRSQFERRAKALEDACIAKVREWFLPGMNRHIAANLPSQAARALTFEVDESTNSPVLLFTYPRAGQRRDSDGLRRARTLRGIIRSQIHGHRRHLRHHGGHGDPAPSVIRGMRL